MVFETQYPNHAVDLLVCELTRSTAVSYRASHARSAIYDSVFDCVQFFDELLVLAQGLCQ